jgi:hypothetical protein
VVIIIVFAGLYLYQKNTKHSLLDVSPAIVSVETT